MKDIALIGCGAVSKEHYVPACKLMPDVSITWFVDKHQNNAKQLVHDYGKGAIATDYHSVKDVDAVIVAVPNALHAEVTTYFLEMGVDVLCEKPIATSLIDAQSMLRSRELTGARLAINHPRRRFNSYRVAKSLIDQNSLGPLAGITYEEGQVFDWPSSSSFLLNPRMSGGGVLIDTGIHVVDLIRWLFNCEMNLMHYEDDGLGRIESNSEIQCSITKDQREIPCKISLSRTRRLDNCMVISGQDSSIKVTLSDLNGVTFQGSGFNGRIESSAKITQNECFADQISALLDPTRDDYTKGEEALNALAFIEQCYASRVNMNLVWDTFRSNRYFSFPSRYNRILIVGASGFLGTRLSERMSLDLNLNVRATVHRAYRGVRLGRLPIELVECDILDFDQVSRAVRDCDVIINCSRDRGLRKKEVIDFYTKGTRNLLEAACTQGVKRFIHISTAAIHGFKHDENFVDETSPTASTRDTYMRGKLEAEKIVSKYAGVILTSILRPTLIYGPYSSNWTVQIIELVRDGQITGIGPDTLANLVYVDDVVQAILLCLERDVVSGEPFIINNDLKLVHWLEYLKPFANQLHTPLQMTREPLLVQKARKSLMLLRDSYSSLRDVLSSPEALGLATRIPIVLKIGQHFVKGEKRQRLQAKVLAQARMKKPNLSILKKYESIPKGLYEVFACRSSFSSARAKSVFGFEPEVSVRDGVQLTLEWAKWARLLQVETENFD